MTQSRRRNAGRPQGWWHDIHPGVRGALISFSILLVFFACSGASLAILASTSLTAALALYVLQIGFYFLNGLITGVQADETRLTAVRQVGHVGERVKINLPSFVVSGAIGGLVLGLLAALVLILASSAAYHILPGLSLLGWQDTPWLFVVTDIIAAVGMGMIGGWFYGQFMAKPGR